MFLGLVDKLWKGKIHLGQKKISLKKIKTKFPYHKKKIQAPKNIKTIKKQKHVQNINMIAKGFSLKKLPLKVFCWSEFSIFMSFSGTSC